MITKLSSPQDSSERPTVILAEDDDMVRSYFVDVLEFAGYEVLSAGDGLGAVELLRGRPDVGVLLTDVEMPRMDGLTLARRARELRREIGVLYVSGCDKREVAGHAVPGSVFLAKSCKSRVLCEAVAAMFAGQQRAVAEAA